MKDEYSELTSKILEAAFEVSNELGIGFLESVYERSLMIALQQKGIAVECQKSIEVKYKGVDVGFFSADLVVENLVILELKASRNLVPEHEAQLLNYLKATHFPIGMLINFGQSKLQYRRYKNSFNNPPPSLLSP